MGAAGEGGGASNKSMREKPGQTTQEMNDNREEESASTEERESIYPLETEPTGRRKTPKVLESRNTEARPRSRHGRRVQNGQQPVQTCGPLQSNRVL